MQYSSFLIALLALCHSSLFLTQALRSEAKTVYIKLDWSYGFWPQKEMREAFAARGYKVQEVRSIAHLPDMAYLITYDVPMQQLDALRTYPKDRCVLVTWEPMVIKPYNFYREYQNLYGKILTWYDDIVDNKTFFKCNYTVWQPQHHQETVRQPRKLCTLIATNKSSGHHLSLFGERQLLVDTLTRMAPDDFDLYGNGWDSAKYANYRGRVGDKYEALGHYKFCICYENTSVNGYITEKIFDAFIAGVVPIYKGAPNIKKWIPADCFISPDDFESLEAMVNYLQTMSEETYQGYQNRITAFMTGPQAQAFSNQRYVNTLMRAIFGK